MCMSVLVVEVEKIGIVHKSTKEMGRLYNTQCFIFILSITVYKYKYE